MVDSKQGSTSSKQNTEVGAKVSNLLQNQSVLLVITLVILGLFFQWGSNGIFLALGTLGTVLTDWGSYILLAVAQTFVVITGGIDLSVGSVVSLSSVIAGWVLVKGLHVDATITGADANGYLLIATLVAVAVGMVVGLVNAFLINILKIVPFIATLATMGAAAGMAIIISGGMPLQGPDNHDLGIDWVVGGVELPMSTTVLVVLLVTVVAGLFLHKSRFGLYTFSLGSNAFATRAAGINVERHLTKIYVLSGGLAGLAGAYAYIRLGSGSPTNGTGMELYAIAATVIGGASLMGGVGRIVGVALGTLVLFTVQSGLLMMQVITVSPDLKQVIVAILIAAAVAVQTLRKSNRK
jgi:ribose transport system permease protein